MNGTFSDLFEELKLEIFTYLDLQEKIRLMRVCREWSSILSRLLTLQETLVIGQSEFDSTNHMKLSLCNINSLHVATAFNTISTNDLLIKHTEDEAAAVVSRLLKKFKKLKSIFIYSPVKMKLSDLPETVEHIHFGHTANVIVFDKTNFERLTCISTIDAHLDQSYSDGLKDLMKAQKSRLENVSVCEVPLPICEQIIEMKNLKQLFVFDFESDFDNLYKEKSFEIMDAHPKLQYFNMFCYSITGDQICPTNRIKWLMEFGSTTPLDRQLIIDVFHKGSLENTLEFAKNFIHGLYLTFDYNFDIIRYKTKLNALASLRVSYNPRSYAFLDMEIVQQALRHIFDIAPNLHNLHLRFVTHGLFRDNNCIEKILNEVEPYALRNPKKLISFQLTALGKRPNITHIVSNLPKNLSVLLSTAVDDSNIYGFN